MKIKLLFFIIIIISSNLYSQKNHKFKDHVLKNPKKYKEQLIKKLNYIEILEFKDTIKADHVVLTNGYARYPLIDKNKWTAYDTSKIVYRVDIVYTKYPKIKRDWITNYYSLLANRLKELFRLDSSLNRNNIEFNTVLQVNCFTAKETKKMYHGIVIYYKNRNEISKKEVSEIDDGLPDGEHFLFDRKKNLPPLLRNLTINDSLATDETTVMKVISQMDMLDDISTPDVYNVLERHPDWKDMVIVMDWTGSMYAYSGQAIMWHALNFKSKRINKFVFFNDGNKKRREEKILGKTGGIYAFDSENLADVIEVMYEITQMGKGGDWPENDTEALIFAQNKWPNVKELFLIADNRSNVRDLSLLEQLHVPVHVILCGNGWAYHIHYLNLAYKTGGTIHTIDDDVESFDKLTKEGKMEIFGKMWYLHNGNVSGVKENLFKSY